MTKYFMLVNSICMGWFIFGAYGLLGGIVIGWILFRAEEGY